LNRGTIPLRTASVSVEGLAKSMKTDELAMNMPIFVEKTNRSVDLSVNILKANRGIVTGDLKATVEYTRMNRERAQSLLGVTHNVTPQQLKKVYYKKALKCHPDKQGNAEEFLELKEAYECLSNHTDPILPLLFDSSIHFVLSALDPQFLLSLYTILLDYKDLIPESVFVSIQKHIPPILILEPTLNDLLQQHVYIYTHNGRKYSIPLWHHELVYDEFTVLCKPNVEMDEENNVYLDVHADIRDVFLNGLFVESISHQVDVSKLHIVPYQIYTTPSTIPKIQEEVYSAKECASFILRIHLV